MWHPEHYVASSRLFLHLLGFIYLCVFGSFLFQIRGLLGREGILPLSQYLDMVRFTVRQRQKRFLFAPTLFWISSSDRALMALTCTGCAVALLLTLGIYPPLMLILLYVLYISIVSTGQDFLSFGWDVFILELTANAFFLSLTTVPNPIIWVSLNFLLFRFHLQAGAVKLQSRDPNWRNLTALYYHYQTQPLPVALAWYIQKWPLWFHKLSALAMFMVEIPIAFGVFGGEGVRLGVFACFFGLQYIIWVTGNFAYLNHMTVAFMVILISDRYLPAWMSANNMPPSIGEEALSILAGCAGAALLFFQVINLVNHFMPRRSLMRLLAIPAPFHLANRYGIFAIMTTKRYEIVVEGSDDGVEWREYLFRFKPGRVGDRPRRISPLHPRLDWQAWFLPFDMYEMQGWFQSFLVRLLQGSPQVLKLLKSNPFPEKPPRYIRAVAYDYVFTDRATKQTTGAWWHRERVGSFSPTLSLKSPLSSPK